MLFASLLLPWFERRPTGGLSPLAERTFNAWQSFRIADVLLALMAVAIVVLALASVAYRDRSLDLAVALLGWLAVAVAL